MAAPIPLGLWYNLNRTNYLDVAPTNAVFGTTDNSFVDYGPDAWDPSSTGGILTIAYPGPLGPENHYYNVVYYNSYIITISGEVFTLDGIGTEPFSTDLNGDSYGDILFQSNSTGQLLFAAMNGGAFADWGAATSPLGSLATSGSGFVAGGKGDVNGDGIADVFVQDQQSGNVLVAEQHGTNTPVWVEVSAALTPNWKLVGAGDFNGDGFADAVAQDQNTGSIIYGSMQDGNFHGWSVISTTLSSDWHVVGIGDINRDWVADVVVRDQVSGMTLYGHTSNGVFAGWVSVAPAIGTDWNVAAVADVTGDGFADVIFQNHITGQAVFASMANGVFSGWGYVAPNAGPTYLIKGAVDVDRDGFTDVIYQDSVHGTTVYAHMGAQGFMNWGAVANVPTDFHIV